MILNETTDTTHTAINEMPCCDRQVRLSFAVEDGIAVHQRKCPTCGLHWTFATNLTVRRRDRANRPSEFGYSVVLREGQVIGPVSERDLADRLVWLDTGNRDALRNKRLEIKQRRRASRYAAAAEH